jgi:hypothetical protein
MEAANRVRVSDVARDPRRAFVRGSNELEHQAGRIAKSDCLLAEA